MCQLFGWSSKDPSSGRSLPMAEFRARGGATADNPDGWGVAWRVGDAFLLEREPLPGHDSAQFERVSCASTVPACGWVGYRPARRQFEPA